MPQDTARMQRMAHERANADFSMAIPPPTWILRVRSRAPAFNWTQPLIISRNASLPGSASGKPLELLFVTDTKAVPDSDLDRSHPEITFL